MASGDKSKRIGHANTSTNRIRKIEFEVKRSEKKMVKLLRLFNEGRPRHCGDKVRKIQGIKSGSKRHKNLQSHIDMLKGKLG
jgi:hypothetical protein